MGHTMAEEMTIVVSGGKARFIYSDDLLGLTAMGKQTTRRASHVEPTDEGWIADLTPVNGPVLGPFPTRSEALQMEVDWLKSNHIPVPQGTIGAHKFGT